jgi:hypothetical protein
MVINDAASISHTIVLFFSFHRMHNDASQQDVDKEIKNQPIVSCTEGLSIIYVTNVLYLSANLYYLYLNLPVLEKHFSSKSYRLQHTARSTGSVRRFLSSTQRSDCLWGLPKQRVKSGTEWLRGEAYNSSPF